MASKGLEREKLQNLVQQILDSRIFSDTTLRTLESITDAAIAKMIVEKMVLDFPKDVPFSSKRLTGVLPSLNALVHSTGGSCLEPVLPILLNKLEERGKQEEKTIRNLIFEAMKSSDQAMIMVFQCYFQTASFRIARVLVHFSWKKSEKFFAYLCDYLLKADNNRMLGMVLELIHRSVMHKDAHLYQIVDFPIFLVFISKLKEINDAAILSISLLALCAILPYTLLRLTKLMPHLQTILMHSLCIEANDDLAAQTKAGSPRNSSSHISPKVQSPQFSNSNSQRPASPSPAVNTSTPHDEFNITNNTNAGDATKSPVPLRHRSSVPFLGAQYPPSELSSSVSFYFSHLYGMFPCCTMEFIKSNKNTKFLHRVAALLQNLPFHPRLIYGSAEEELDPVTWRSKEVHTIVTDSVGALYINQNQFSDYSFELKLPKPRDEEGQEAQEKADQNLDLQRKPGNVLDNFCEPQGKEKPGEIDSVSNIIANVSKDSHDQMMLQIIEVQKLLQSKLSVGPPLDPWKRTQLATSVPINLEEWQRDNLLARNELLYERYLRQKYLERFADFYKTVSANEKLEGEIQALKAIIEEQDKTAKNLIKAAENDKKSYLTNRKERSEESAKLHSRIENLSHQYTSVLEKNAQYSVQLEDLKQQTLALREETNKVYHLYTEVQAENNSLKAKVEVLNIHRRCLSRIRTDLVLYEHNLSNRLKKAGECDQWREKYDEANRAILSLRTDIEKLEKASNRSHRRYLRAEERVKDVEKEKTEMEHKFRLQNTSMHNITQSHAAKLEAIDTKYRNCRHINVMLERRLAEVQTDLLMLQRKFESFQKSWEQQQESQRD